MDILYFQGVRPFRLGGEPSWISFTSKGYDPLGWGGTIMDILYFQGVRPFIKDVHDGSSSANVKGRILEVKHVHDGSPPQPKGSYPLEVKDVHDSSLPISHPQMTRTYGKI